MTAKIDNATPDTLAPPEPSTPPCMLSWMLEEFVPHDRYRDTLVSSMLLCTTVSEAVVEFDLWAKICAKEAVTVSMPDGKLPASGDEQMALRDRHLGKIEDFKKILHELLPKLWPEKFGASAFVQPTLEQLAHAAEDKISGASKKRAREGEDEEDTPAAKKMKTLPVPDPVPSKVLDDSSAPTTLAPGTPKKPRSATRFANFNGAMIEKDWSDDEEEDCAAGEEDYSE